MHSFLFFAALLLLSSILSTSASAQPNLGYSAENEPAPIEDNSFLLEEAYNQEAGVVQHIFTYERDFDTKDWTLALEQEWPLWSQEHQLSYELPLVGVAGSTLSGVTGIGDVVLSYRYQLLGIEDHDIAFAPRVSVILPTGDADKNLGNGGIGFELGLPLSLVLHPSLVAHTNASASLAPKAVPPFNKQLINFQLGQSVIWLPFAKFNVLMEAIYGRSYFNGSDMGDSFIINPGVRWAHDFDSGLQIVPGISVPMTLGDEASTQIFIYLSLEHNF
jgi:hypothetical protein